MPKYYYETTSSIEDKSFEANDDKAAMDRLRELFGPELLEIITVYRVADDKPFLLHDVKWEDP